MCKHYGLDSIIPQTNSFVVYDSFFDGRSGKEQKISSLFFKYFKLRLKLFPVITFL